MPGNRLLKWPASAYAPEDCADDTSRLERILQLQLEEDIASDVYTECDVKLQEPKIISYLNETLPYIESNGLDTELNDQDTLSNVFKTFITSENKPTTLPLRHSHTKKIRHSNSCDIYKSLCIEKGDFICRDTKPYEKLVSSAESVCTLQNSYTPDSLIIDDQSSDVSSPLRVRLNEISNKMSNVYPSTDSGLENTGYCDSLSSHKNNSLTDISLTENTFQDTQDDTIYYTQYSGNTTQSVPCFIDASSLVDVVNVGDTTNVNTHNDNALQIFKPSKQYGVWQPDASPTEWSEDDLDITDNKDSIQKDLSPSTIEITPMTEDSIFSNEGSEQGIKTCKIDKDSSLSVEDFKTSTPNNSILTVNMQTPVTQLLDTGEETMEKSSTVVNKKTEDVALVTGLYISGASTSDSCKSSHKYFLDISNMPSKPSPPKKEADKKPNKNMFSMYIDASEMNASKKKTRLLSSSSIKRIKKADINDPHTFELVELLCEDPNFSLSEIFESGTDIPKKTEKLDTKSARLVAGSETKKSHRDSKMTMPTLDQKPVKLADLENSCSTLDMCLTANIDEFNDIRMTRSIPDSNWRDLDSISRACGSQRISSFHSENATSLNRLFPNLKNELSKSMPGSLSNTAVSSLRLGFSSNPDELHEQASIVSELTSPQSSVTRSDVENGANEQCPPNVNLVLNCRSRLGEDLLRMFVQEIASDVIVEVAGKRIKAHKCILSSRCQYFAGILSGSWVESAGNVIVLPTFSYNVVYFALCHIYAGISEIPDSISILELATIADMLGLEGLKEAIMLTLKEKYCHNFHRPCTVCTAGVLECFPLTSAYGLDDLYRKCLLWISKYFSKIWPTKCFATLPRELLDKCCQQQIVNLSMDNLLETVYGCGVAASSLHGARWAESVRHMCRRVSSAAAQYAAPRLVAVLRALSAVPPDAPPAALQALHDCVINAIPWAPPDEACQAYAFLSTLLDQLHNTPSANDNFLHANAYKWCQLCESELVNAAPRVVDTQAFKELPISLRKTLRELGCIMYGARPKQIQSPVQERKKRHKNPSSTLSLDIDHVRTSFVPYAQKPVTAMTKGFSTNTQFQRQSKLPLPKVRMTKAQEERAKYNMMKSHQSNQIPSKTYPVRASSLSNVKLRAETKTEKGRPSSMKYAGADRGGWGEARTSTSQDSLATSSRPRTGEPSTDSLTESQTSCKYATYTKSKSLKNRPPQNQVSEIKLGQQQSSSPSKTRISVYSNQKSQKSESQRNTSNVSNNNTTATQSNRRNLGSLMNATKSSSAKMVLKVVKDQQTTPKRSRDTARCAHKSAASASTSGMQRSETFLKEEPTFGDKTNTIE